MVLKFMFNDNDAMKQKKGQSLVEFTLVLPFLLLLFLGLIEAGYAMYDYIVLSNANREGVRLAARGQFNDANIIDRLIGAGGYTEVDDEIQPNLRTSGDDANLGIIITHIPLPSDADSNWHQQIKVSACCEPNCPEPDPDKINVTQCLMGVINEGGANRDIVSADSVITDIQAYQNSVDITEQINEIRAKEKYNAQGDVLVVVETFMAHYLLLPVDMPDYTLIPNPFTLRFLSTMRVTLNTRNTRLE